MLQDPRHRPSPVWDAFRYPLSGLRETSNPLFPFCRRGAIDPNPSVQRPGQAAVHAAFPDRCLPPDDRLRPGHAETLGRCDADRDVGPDPGVPDVAVVCFLVHEDGGVAPNRGQVSSKQREICGRDDCLSLCCPRQRHPPGNPGSAFPLISTEGGTGRLLPAVQIGCLARIVAGLRAFDHGTCWKGKGLGEPVVVSRVEAKVTFSMKLHKPEAAACASY